jgi:hypothetical protein
MKSVDHPVYDILLNEPSSFLEVKGEWSLAKLTSLLNPQSRQNSELATKKYLLLRESLAAEELFTGNEENSFLKYPSYVKTIRNDIPEVSIISDSLYTLIRDIYHGNECIYPNPGPYSFSKQSSIKKIRPSKLIGLFLFSFDTSPEVILLIFFQNYIIKLF